MKSIRPDFLLFGALGSFHLPAGESRVGSDAACEICIRGDGILPTHAYLRSDGEKVLIRPANPESSSGSARAAITVEGSLITGPAVVLPGQSVGFGPIQFKLQRGQAQKIPSVWALKWLRIAAFSILGVALLSLIAFAYVRFIVLSDDSLRQIVKDAAHEMLGRPGEDVEVEKFDVRIWDGRIDVSNLKIKEKFDFQSSPSYFVTVPSLIIKLDAWAFLTSWKRNLHNLDIAIDGDTSGHVPEIVLERSKTDGSLNIDDCLQKISGSRSGRLPFSRLDFLLKVNNGVVRLRDPFNNIGETSLENITLALSMKGAGKPIEIEKCEMRVNANPAPPEPGTLKISGRIGAIDEVCAVDLKKLSAESLTVDMTNFDLARVFEHFGYAWEPHGANFKVVLGKPINGSLEIDALSPRDITLRGHVTSDSLVSIKEEGQPSFGNISSDLKCGELHLVKEDVEGALFVPKSVDVKLESWTNPTRREPAFLTLSSRGQMNPSNGTSQYLVELNCELRDLLNTDVGHRLKLDGSLGGALIGKADLIVDANNGMKVVAKFDGNDTYVNLKDVKDPSKPPIRQPIPLSFECIGNAQRDANGELDYVDVAQFALIASSFSARSETASRIEFNRKDDRIAAEAKFKLDLHGADFCREFSPILSLFGFKEPLNEDFALEVLVHGKKNIVGVHSVGTASRTWKPLPAPDGSGGGVANDPAPVKVEMDLYYNKLMRETHDPKLLGALPYLSLTVHTFSTGEKRLDVAVEANCTRRDGCEAIELVHLDGGKDTGDPGVKIDADIAAFRNRFSPYIEMFLKSGVVVAKTRDDLLNLYGHSMLTGFIHHEGRIKIKHVSIEAQNPTDHVDFEFNTQAGFKAATLNLSAKGPATVAGEWSEPKLSLELSGSYEQCLNANPEEPDKLRLLNIDALKVEGSLGRFVLQVRELDLLALPGLRTAANKTWTDALAGMTIVGTISPQATVLAKSLGILDPLDPVSGTLDLQMAFDRSRDALELKQFDFRKSGDFYVTSLNASGTLARVKGISARLFPTQPNTSTLAERAAGWLDESGPSAFFDHLGNELRIHEFEVDSKLFRGWLATTFKPGGDARKVPTLFAGILNGTWEPQGVWRADQVQLARDLNYPDTWRLNGTFRSDFKARVPTSDDAAAPVVTLANPWKVALGLSLNKENAASIHGDVAFDETRVHASIPALQFDYDKPAKEPFKIMLEGCASTRGVLPTSIAKLNVTGKFGEFELRNFCTTPYGASLQFSVENFNVKSTGLECSGAIPNFDLKGDKLEARLESPSLELRGLPELWRLALQSTHGIGRLKNVAFGYKGGLVALSAALPPELRPKIDNDDPRRFGVQAGVDAFELEGDLDGVRIDASKEFGIELGGRVRIAADEMACKNFTAEIRGWFPAGGPEMAVQKASHVQKFSIPKLYIKSTDLKLSLRLALAAPGMPLEIRGDVVCDKPLTEAQLATLKNALKGTGAESIPTEKMDWPSVSKLFVSGGLKVPSVAVDSMKASQVEIRNANFRDLKLSMPVLTASVFGGHLKLEDAEYDFSKVAAKSGLDGGPRGLRHSQRVTFTDGDVCESLEDGNVDPVRYGVCGKFGAQGPFGGIDFKGMDRLSWNGALKCEFSNVAITAPVMLTDRGISPLPWMGYFRNHASGRGTLLARASATDSATLLELSVLGGTVESNAANVFDGFLAASELYFAKLYGVELEKMEFETFTPTVRVDKGLAVFEPFELKGKGATTGFDIQVRNLKLNLADETFADEVLIYPIALPQTAQNRLSLDKWPPLTRQLFLTSMSAGRMPLRISGPLSAPSVKFPWAEASAMARTALFGVDAITDADSLSKAREHFLRVWSKEDAGMQAAAMLADRLGAGLPGTLSSRLTRETIVDRATKLPPKIVEAAAKTAALRPELPLSTPLESLRVLMFAEPEVPVAPEVPLLPSGLPPAVKSDKGPPQPISGKP